MQTVSTFTRLMTFNKNNKGELQQNEMATKPHR